MTDGAKDGTSNESANDTSTDGKQADDLTGLKTALQAERDAHKAEAKRAKDLEKRLADLENSGKSESEKLAARLEALEKDNQSKAAAIRERDARDAVRDAAKKAGAGDPDIVYRFLRADLEYDDDGSVTNLAAVIKDAKEIAPQLFKPITGKGDGGAGNGTQPKNNDMNATIRRMAGVAE